MGVQRVLQVDLKMESFPEPLGSRWMAWQVEYPSSRSATQEAETEIRLAQEELAGIVPLAMVSGLAPNRWQCISHSGKHHHVKHHLVSILHVKSSIFACVFIQRVHEYTGNDSLHC